jgi:hypothetical protein
MPESAVSLLAASPPKRAGRTSVRSISSVCPTRSAAPGYLRELAHGEVGFLLSGAPLTRGGRLVSSPPPGGHRGDPSRSALGRAPVLPSTRSRDSPCRQIAGPTLLRHEPTEALSSAVREYGVGKCEQPLGTVRIFKEPSLDEGSPATRAFGRRKVPGRPTVRALA